MPTKKEGESQNDFVTRCIPIVIKEGTAKDEKQAAAICHSMYKEQTENNFFKPHMPTPHKGETIDQFMIRCKPVVSAVGHTPEMADYCCLVSWDCWVNDEQPPDFPPLPGGQDGDEQGKPIYDPKMPLYPGEDGHGQLNAQTRELYQLDMDCDHAMTFIKENTLDLKDTQDEPNKFSAVALIGDRFYHGKFLPYSEIEKAYKSMDGAYHDINHWGTSYPIDGHPNIEYIIGYQKNTKMDMQKKMMKTNIIVNPDAPHYKTWKSFMDITRQAGRTPNVSVSFWASNKTMKARDLPKGINYAAEGYTDDSDIKTLYDVGFQALSTVFKGACDDSQGCGIGLSQTNDKEKEKLELMVEIEKNKSMEENNNG